MAKALKSKQTGADIAVYEARMAEMAAAQSAIEVTASQWFKTKSGQLSFDGNKLKDNKINVVVVGSAYEHARYEGDYDPDNPQSPVCFALSESGKDMKPAPESSTPQSESCAACRWNAFGTSDKGAGKGCKQTRRLALIAADTLDDAEHAPIALIRVPVTSGKTWATYVKSITETLKRPTLGVVTELAVVPDDKTQFKFVFTFVEKLGAVVGALFARTDEARSMLLTPFSKFEAPKPKPKPRAGKKAKY